MVYKDHLITVFQAELEQKNQGCYFIFGIIDQWRYLVCKYRVDAGFVPQGPTSEPVNVNWSLSVMSNRLWVRVHHLLMRESHNSFIWQLAGEAEVKHIAKAKLQPESCSIMS